VDVRKLRVVLAVSNYDQLVDGVALTLSRLVDYLEREAGVDVMVVTPEFEKPEVKTVGKRVVRCAYYTPVESWRYRIGIFDPTTQATVEAFRPHLVHVGDPGALGVMILRWAAQRDVARIATFHTAFAHQVNYHVPFMERPVMWYLSLVYSMADRVLPPTRAMARDLVRGGFRAETMGIWGRGVDMSDFSAALRDEALRAELGASAERPLVLFVGRMVWEKNLVGLARALRELAARGVPHSAVVVGSGPALEEMRGLCPAETRFLGRVEGAALARVYASADIFFFPSDTETFGRVTLEAMASGLPVVGGAGGGTLDLVEEGVQGYLLPASDAEGMAAAIERLVRDGPLRARMAQAAVARSRLFTWPPILADMVRNYQDVIALATERRGLRDWTKLCDPPAPDDADGVWDWMPGSGSEAVGAGGEGGGGGEAVSSGEASLSEGASLSSSTTHSATNGESTGTHAAPSPFYAQRARGASADALEAPGDAPTSSLLRSWWQWWTADMWEAGVATGRPRDRDADRGDAPEQKEQQGDAHATRPKTSELI
jgi:phosphatidylinositol alpha 1,6-mannosyltransferase